MPYVNLSLCQLFEFSDDPDNCIRECVDCRYELFPCAVCQEEVVLAKDHICDKCLE